MKYSIVAVTFASIAATGASAQELTYGQLYAGTSELSVDGAGDTNIEVFGGGFEFAVNSFTFSADAARVSTDFGDVDVATIAGEYKFAMGLSLGIEHARADFEGIDTSINSIFAVYETGPYGFGLSLGDSDDLEDEVVGVFASMDVTTNSVIGFEHLSLDDVDLNAIYSQTDADRYDFYAAYVDIEEVDGIILEGGFDIVGNFALTGGYARFSDGFADLNAYSIGAEYGVTDRIDIGASIGRISIDGASEDVDVVSFGIEFETGRRTSSRSRASEVLGRAGNSLNGSFGY